MNPKELIVKCYAKQEEGMWVAVCLDFCLATQGDSLNEVKRKLEEQITFYVGEALEDKEYGNQLLGGCPRIRLPNELPLIGFGEI